MTETVTPKATLALSEAPTISSLSEADLAKRINDTFEMMATSFNTNALRAIEVGELLNEAKRKVKHGAFEEWLRVHCQLSFSTARRYMKFAENRKGIEQQLKMKSVNLTDLSLTAAQRLIEAGSSSTNGEREEGQKPEPKRRELSQKQKLKQVEDFKKTWESFEDWQRRRFLKPFKDRVRELIEEVESEVAKEAAA